MNDLGFYLIKVAYFFDCLFVATDLLYMLLFLVTLRENGFVFNWVLTSIKHVKYVVCILYVFGDFV